MCIEVIWTMASLYELSRDDGFDTGKEEANKDLTRPKWPSSGHLYLSAPGCPE